MKTFSRTTTAGSMAALTLSAAQCPGLPKWLEVFLTILAAASLALLGRNAADCPANCPGTDANGRPHPPNRSFGPFAAGLLGLALLVVTAHLVGCVTANPKAGPANPSEPAYIVSPQLHASSNAVVAIARDVGPLTGTGPAAETAATAAFALAGALSVLWARHKSKVATTLAQGVVKSGSVATQTTLDHASTTDHYAAVATLLNHLTAAGQAPGSVSPSTSAHAPVDAKTPRA